jgi:hypothetical protein
LDSTRSEHSSKCNLPNPHLGLSSPLLLAPFCCLLLSFALSCPLLHVLPPRAHSCSLDLAWPLALLSLCRLTLLPSHSCTLAFSPSCSLAIDFSLFPLSCPFSISRRPFTLPPSCSSCSSCPDASHPIFVFTRPQHLNIDRTCMQSVRGIHRQSR